jgi:hypothetical protein
MKVEIDDYVRVNWVESKESAPTTIYGSSLNITLLSVGVIFIRAFYWPFLGPSHILISTQIGSPRGRIPYFSCVMPR